MQPKCKRSCKIRHKGYNSDFIPDVNIMRKYVAIKTLIHQKFNIFIDTGDEGVITDPKPAIYGLNRDAVELFYIVVHLGYIRI